MGPYDQILGPLLIGILFNTYLYGIVTYQFASYYRADFNDRLAVKCAVAFLLVLDTVHSIALIYMVWVYMVTNYTNPTALQYFAWPYPFTPIGTALAALVTQIFLGDRIYRLTHNKVIYGIVIMMALPAFGLGIACGIEAWFIHVLADVPRVNGLATAWVVMQVIVDTFLTVTLSIILARAKTGLPITDGVLRRLIRGAIQTGVFAIIFCLGELITFLLLPNASFYGMFGVPVGRIYSNTLLDTLLVREKLKKELSSTAFQRASQVMGWIPMTRVTPGPAATSLHLEVHRSLHDTTDVTSTYDEGQKNTSIDQQH
ncbi:hypothetical protein F5J12DRAFT_854947 [Pisolithus orientalis]|uniref:uncharacterized protein n=1 Tax=Pisolithus orientalis TaxID=936130 RepID=UPI002224F1E0|nr:uncharacterized protein F5J12DRAFT_854947 [Pisolithus orientalis]KAI5995775.1 hypothetical protein F5J12DRAFT_854947 [Pisolithus orientalis]